MNVFVLNTGRCGSTTFTRACQHITNYSSAHESRRGRVGRERLVYPEAHIESDNRLSWLLGRLDKKYGDSAFYVHLKRSDAETARSFTKRYSFGIIKAYRDNGILTGLPEDTDPFAVALDYCDTVNSNIDLFLKDKTHKIVIELNDVEQGFAEFWRRIGAEGDFNAALSEFSVKHNQTTIHHERIFNGSGSRGPNRNKLIARASSKFKRAIGNFPGYLRAV